MDLHAKIFGHICFVCAVFAFSRATCATTEIQANPDYLSSGISWTTEGIPGIKIGDVLRFHYFSVGGMFEVRNEKRFNQNILPNHSWRGVGAIRIPLPILRPEVSHLSFTADISHESAHPTMGIQEPTGKAYELIYDGVYRRMMLNSAGISSTFFCSNPGNRFFAGLRYNFYFYSKNTPELAGSRLGLSNGFSLGAENHFLFKKNMNLYVSVFDRIILKSNTTDFGWVHEGNDNTLSTVERNYPVINQVNTIVFKTGIVISYRGICDLDPYFRLLYGNPYGFIDSRDNRLVVSFGIDVTM
jgi:hypothetical protein